MDDWKDPAILAKCASLLANLSYATSGAYTMEMLYTIVYDYEIVTRKRPWKWTMLLYFITKWIMFFCTTAFILLLSIDYPIDCQALSTFVELAGNVSIGSASTLLVIRTSSIWKRSLWVTIPLTCLLLGQWAILFHGITIKSVFDPDVKACLLVSTGEEKHLGLKLQHLFTMGLDLIVLALSTIGLLTSARSSLWKLLFRDGIIYFVMAFSANLTVSVFVLLNLNPNMDMMFFLPAACITASAATRSFIRLDTDLISNIHVENHSIDHQPGAYHVSADRDVQVITWTCTQTDVDAKFSTSQRCGNCVQ